MSTTLVSFINLSFSLPFFLSLSFNLVLLSQYFKCKSLLQLDARNHITLLNSVYVCLLFYLSLASKLVFFPKLQLAGDINLYMLPLCFCWYFRSSFLFILFKLLSQKAYLYTEYRIRVSERFFIYEISERIT